MNGRGDTAGGRIVPLVGLALALAVVWVYEDLRHHDFVLLDDGYYLFQNPRIRLGLTLENLRWAFTTTHADFWHPLTWLSYLVDVEIHGFRPSGFLTTNLVLHGANAILLFLALRAFTGATGCSALTAALFALHPLHVESVAWAAERKDVLSTFFGLISLWVYARYARRCGWGAYLAVTLFFTLSLMAKPMLVTLPCVLLLLDFWPLGRLGGPFGPEAGQRKGGAETGFRPVLEKIPLMGLSAVAAVAAYTVQKSMHSLVTLDQSPLAVRMANAVVAYGLYLKKTLWPVDLAVFYPFAGMPPAGQVVLSAAVLLLLTWAALGWWRSHPWRIVGWLWYTGTLVPVIGLVQVGDFALADRYTYIPLTGIFIMGVWESAYWWRRRSGSTTVAVIVALGLCAGLAVGAKRQVGHWKDSVALFRHAVAVTRNNVKMHMNLGLAYEAEKNWTAAVAQYRRALALRPENAPIANQMGMALVRSGRSKEAEAAFRRAADNDPQDPAPLHNLGLLLGRQGRLTEAAARMQQALALDAKNADTHNNLGAVLLRMGRVEAAEAHFRSALALVPGHRAATANLRRALWEDERPSTTRKGE